MFAAGPGPDACLARRHQPDGYAGGVDLRSVILAPVTIATRTVQALDDLAAIADRARREPDPVEEVRERLDRVLDELTALRATAAEVDATGRQIVTGGRELTDTAKVLTGTAATLEHDTRELIDGGQDLTAVAERISADLRTFRAMLPKVFGAIDTLEKLEDEIETVAETVEPLQGAAERVGRVTRRLSRS